MSDHADTIRRDRQFPLSLEEQQAAIAALCSYEKDVTAYRELGKRLADGLAATYPTYPEAVAELCDMWLDRSGRLLGEVREAAAKP